MLKGFDQILAAEASQAWVEAEKFLLPPPPRDEAQEGEACSGSGEGLGPCPRPPGAQCNHPSGRPCPFLGAACLATEQAFSRAAAPCRLLTPRSPSPHPLPRVRALSFTFSRECPVY